MPRTAQEQLVHFLSDVYAMEQQALAQLVSAPEVAGDPRLAEMFSVHLRETERQSVLVRERLEAHGESPSTVKDAVMRLGGKAFLLFARVMPETPGRLMAHAYAYEAMEWAAYGMLIRIADRAGDARTAQIARVIQAEERAMMERLERGFNAADEASHRATPDADGDPEVKDQTMKNQVMKDQVIRHLGEAHAIEAQAESLLARGESIAGGPGLEQIYRQHLAESRTHAALLEERLSDLGSSPSVIKDAALRFGAVNWSMFFAAQPDTPAKLAAFAYAFEHLEIGGYELLRRAARRAHDVNTERVCERILGDERAMSERLIAAFDEAVDATLDAVQA